jgi:hypothetical protein
MGFLSSQLRVLAAQETGMTAASHATILEFYRSPGTMADAGKHAALFEALPDDVPSIAKAVTGLLLHQHIAPAYGEKLSSERIGEAQMRSADKILGCVLDHDNAALTKQRPLAKRTIGVCRHYTLLLVAMLRAKGYAARSRCGFGAYFEKGKFLDHWVGEYCTSIGSAGSWSMHRWTMCSASCSASISIRSMCRATDS